MKVYELVEELTDCEQELDVFISVDYKGATFGLEIGETHQYTDCVGISGTELEKAANLHQERLKKENEKLKEENERLKPYAKAYFKYVIELLEKKIKEL